MLFRDPKADLAHLAIVGTDGQAYREIIAPFRAGNLRNKLTWSRDGRWIFFTTKTGGDEADLHRVMRIAAAGGTPEPAGTEIEGLEAFDANPDGTRLAFSTLRPEGAGIGLSIVNETARAHEGTVEVEDAHPGARFRMVWPCPPGEIGREHATAR